jgi:hypothetical protein
MTNKAQHLEVWQNTPGTEHVSKGCLGDRHVDPLFKDQSCELVDAVRTERHW